MRKRREWEIDTARPGTSFPDSIGKGARDARFFGNGLVRKIRGCVADAPLSLRARNAKDPGHVTAKTLGTKVGSSSLNCRLTDGIHDWLILGSIISRSQRHPTRSKNSSFLIG